MTLCDPASSFPDRSRDVIYGVILSYNVPFKRVLFSYLGEVAILAGEHQDAKCIVFVDAVEKFPDTFQGISIPTTEALIYPIDHNSASIIFTARVR